MNEDFLDNATDYSSNNAMDELFRTPSNIAYVIVCSVIVTLNIILNTIYIYLYYKARVPTTNFNLCLAHYSASLVCGNFGFLPYLFTDETRIKTTDAMTQRLLCGIVLDGLYFMFWGGAVCAFMLTFMAVIRCLIIKYPFMGMLSKKKIHRFAALFWLMGFILMIPNVIPWKIDREHGLCVRTKELGDVLDVVYLLTATAFSLIIPPIVMLICLIIIVVHCFQSVEAMTNQTTIRHRKSIVKSLVYLIVIFLICGFGLFLYNSLSIFGYFSEEGRGEYQKYKSFRYALIPILLEGVLNVVAYNLGNSNIRDAYLQLFKKMRHNCFCNSNAQV